MSTMKSRKIHLNPSVSLTKSVDMGKMLKRDELHPVLSKEEKKVINDGYYPLGDHRDEPKSEFGSRL